MFGYKFPIFYTITSEHEGSIIISLCPLEMESSPTAFLCFKEGMLIFRASCLAKSLRFSRCLVSAVFKSYWTVEQQVKLNKRSSYFTWLQKEKQVILKQGKSTSYCVNTLTR